MNSSPLGIEIHAKDKCVVFEITPCDHNQRQQLVSNGRSIIGMPALHKGLGFININFYDLPHMPQEQLSSNIKRMLQPYGKILDICILYHQHTNFFKGQGCACLDITASDQKLSTHTLKSSDLDHHIYTFWKGSPSYCKICQEDTHEK